MRHVALLILVASAASPQDAPRKQGGLIERYLELARAREVHLKRLEAYARERRFPANYHLPGQVPIFKDEKGRCCAVADLVAFSGQSDLVDRIASEQNRVRIAEVKGGPLLDWILRSGLTQEECALIQPTYKQDEQRKRAEEEERARREQEERDRKAREIGDGEVQREKEKGTDADRQAEIKRLQDHFKRVLAQLHEDTPSSLETALRRTAPQALFLLKPMAGANLKARIVNLGAGEVRARSVVLDDRAQATASYDWRAISPGRHLAVASSSSRTWIFVEWECSSPEVMQPLVVVRE